MNICFADSFHNCSYYYCDHKFEDDPSISVTHYNDKNISLNLYIKHYKMKI